MLLGIFGIMMRYHFFPLLLFILGVFIFTPQSFGSGLLLPADSGISRSVRKPPASLDQKTIFVIPVEGDVEPAMAAIISRALREASRYPDPLIILEMDTYGGRVDAAFQIVDTMLGASKGQNLSLC